MAPMQVRLMHARLASSLQLGHVPCTKPACAIQRMPSLVSQVSQNPVTRTIGTGVVAMVAVKNTSFASKSQARTWILLVIRSTPIISNVQICKLWYDDTNVDKIFIVLSNKKRPFKGPYLL